MGLGNVCSCTRKRTREEREYKARRERAVQPGFGMVACAEVLEDNYRALRRPAKKLIKNKTKNTMKQILAIPADAAAIPPKPRTAAIKATTRNTQAYQSMMFFNSSVLCTATELPYKSVSSESHDDQWNRYNSMFSRQCTTCYDARLCLEGCTIFAEVELFRVARIALFAADSSSLGNHNRAQSFVTCFGFGR